MTKFQRDCLRRLMKVTNDFGGSLDATATNNKKYIDRQQAHSKVSMVIFYVFGDHPDNDNRQDDKLGALKLLTELELLAKKNYPDKNGYIKDDEKYWIEKETK